MSDIILPGPGRDYSLVPTLALIEALERDASLLKTVERLLQGGELQRSGGGA